MVGKVKVRGQGPVRRGQTTTTFKKGGRVKKQLGGAMPGVGAAGVQRPLAAGAQPLAAGVQRPVAAGVQSPVGGGVRPGARMAKKGGSIKKAKGGRVKLMHGGRPSARTRHIENEKEEISRVDRNIRRNEGYKTGGRVKKVKGGTAFKKVGTKFRTLVEDWKDSGKKLNVHQDPRSKMSAQLRHMRDNPPKKKSKSPHTETKKRKIYDTSKLPGYVKPKRIGRSRRSNPMPLRKRGTRPTPRNK